MTGMLEDCALRRARIPAGSSRDRLCALRPYTDDISRGTNELLDPLHESDSRLGQLLEIRDLGDRRLPPLHLLENRLTATEHGRVGGRGLQPTPIDIVGDADFD